MPYRRWQHGITWTEQQEILGSIKGGSGISTLKLTFETTTDVATFDFIIIGANCNIFAHLNKYFKNYYFNISMEDILQPACMIWHLLCLIEVLNMASL